MEGGRQWCGARVVGRACESGGVADYLGSLSQDGRFNTGGMLSMFRFIHQRLLSVSIVFPVVMLPDTESVVVSTMISAVDSHLAVAFWAAADAGRFVLAFQLGMLLELLSAFGEGFLGILLRLAQMLYGVV